MRALITGIAGFAGSHLAGALQERGHEVAGIALPADEHPHLADLAAAPRVFEGDVRDAELVGDAIATHRPDVIYHLAAITHVGKAWQDRRATFEINILGTATVLQAAAEAAPARRVVLASTGQVYDPERGGAPFTEDSPLEPVNPYAASKRCAEVLAAQATAGEQLPVVVVRTFNFTGPRQSPDFVCSDFARQVAWAEAGLGPTEMSVGNLEARRDFSDVRDIIDGYIRAAEQGHPGRVYNLASGRAVRIGDVLDRLLSLARVTITVHQDPARLRRAEIPVLCGDAGRARDELGWRPGVAFEDTLLSVLEYWRAEAGLRAAASGS